MQSAFRSILPALLRTVLLASLCIAANAHATMVRLQTTLGLIDIKLLDAEAPATVANFLGYVNKSSYDGTFFHRRAAGFVLQGGGYTWTDALGYVKVPAGPPVVNEFSATRSNVRGTIAMAKLGGNPNSATTEWFFNLADNAGNLDNQNGGFTVFGRVTAPGMAVVDAIAKLSTIGCGGAFTDLPVVSPTTCKDALAVNFVFVKKASVLPAALGDTDRLFNYLEAAYPQYVPTAGSSAGNALGYDYRYYPQTNSYVGVKDGKVYYLVPAIDNNINLLGNLADLLATAVTAGY